MASLYSSFFCSVVFIEPGLHPSFPVGYVLLPARLQAEGDVVSLQLRTGRERCQHNRGKQGRFAVFSKKIKLLLLNIEVDATVNEFLDRDQHLKRITTYPWQLADKKWWNAVFLAIIDGLHA